MNDSVFWERFRMFTKNMLLSLLFAEIQTQNPKITFNRRKYAIGEWLEVNCTSGFAHPVPELTWLLNGDEVSALNFHFQYSNDDFIKKFSTFLGEKLPDKNLPGTKFTHINNADIIPNKRRT